MIEAPSGSGPVIRGPLAQALIDLAETPDDATTIDVQLVTIVGRAARRVAVAEYASVTALRDGDYTTVAASSNLARAVDEAQYTEGGGPCVQAVGDGAPVAVADIDTTMRWPGFRRTALTLGLRASVSLPLFTGSGRVTAVLNMYGRDDAAMAPLIVAVWAAYYPDRPLPTGVGDLPALEPGAGELLLGFTEALLVRSTIQLAIGILMDHHHSTDEQAYLRLRLRAAETAASLTTTATRLITEPTGR